MPLLGIHFIQCYGVIIFLSVIWGEKRNVWQVLRLNKCSVVEPNITTIGRSRRVDETMQRCS